VTALAALVAALAGWLVGRRILRPLQRLTTGAALIAGDPNPEHRLPTLTSPLEVASLSDTLNRMLDRTGASIESTRRFIGDVGHELRTPMAALGMHLESLISHPGMSAED